MPTANRAPSLWTMQSNDRLYVALLGRWHHGGALRVLNPGDVPAAGYFSLADVVVTFEGSYRDYVHRSDGADPPDRDVAHLVFGATDDEARSAAAARRARYVYVSEASLPNPWRRIASTLDAQRRLLARC